MIQIAKNGGTVEAELDTVGAIVDIFLMVADILFLWIASIPLGILSGIVWELSPFVIYFCMKIDQVIKFGWAIIRLRSSKWIKKINGDTLVGEYRTCKLLIQFRLILFKKICKVRICGKRVSFLIQHSIL